jgi:hypothetical protein
MPVMEDGPVGDFDACVPGRRGKVELHVSDEDTAVALGSGDVAVLGTPRVLAIAEQASRQALGDALPPEMTTVGSWVEIDQQGRRRRRGQRRAARRPWAPIGVLCHHHLERRGGRARPPPADHRRPQEILLTVGPQRVSWNQAPRLLVTVGPPSP